MATKSATPTITTTMLRSLGACEVEWPDGAEATLENVLRAVELGIDLEWGAKRLFTPAARGEYYRQTGALWDEYNLRVSPFRVERDNRMNAIWDEYEQQKGALWAEYHQLKAARERRVNAAWDEYEQQIASLKAEYNQQKATIWLAAFLASQTD